MTSLGIRDLHLSANEIDEVIAIIREYADVFACSDVDLGRTAVVQHTINTGDADPIMQRPQRIPYCERPKLEGEVHRLLDAEVIQPSSSPWASPIVLVRKKDGGVRMRVYFRKVNRNEKGLFPFTTLGRDPVPRNWPASWGLGILTIHISVICRQKQEFSMRRPRPKGSSGRSNARKPSRL